MEKVEILINGNTLYFFHSWNYSVFSLNSHRSEEFNMSVHPSLKTKGSVGEKRNVMKRYERIDQLKKEGRYKDGDKAWGLPKTKPVE